MEHVKIQLFDKNGNVQYGLNWGQRENRDRNQAYLQLDPEIYNTDYFPAKGKFFIVKTDDGHTIIFNRAQKNVGTALQTPENNAQIGLYLRNRMGVPSEAPITKDDIIRYGRSDIDFYKIDDMNYRLDFSNGKEVVKPLKRNNQPLQQIFYGAPGTGKSFEIQKELKKYGNDKAVRTTFHPDSDYASFVGAYKPTMSDVKITTFNGTQPLYAESNDAHPGTERKIVYKFVPQAFLKAYVQAWKDLSNPYYLVIEEINRGNCAQIFGDLFQLLDRNSQGCSSYAIHADDDIRQFLEDDDRGFKLLSNEQREEIEDFIHEEDNGSENPIGKKILSGELLLLPPNLHIWATMNTSDQSLFPIDSAFKRRWNWEYVPIEYDKKNWLLEVGGNRYRWGDFLAAINPIIYDLTDSTDKQMGYFFAKPDKKSDPSLKENDIISEKLFLNKVLFYLWTDVLKDYDVSEEPFIVKGSDPQRTYRFTDFFDKGHSYLEEFISKDKLGLKRIEEKDSGDGVEEIEDYLDSYVEDAGQNSPKSLGRYTINGTGSFFMGPAVVEVMKLYISQNPELTAAAIVANWSDFRYPKVYLAHQYEAKKAISKDSRIDNKHTSFDLPNGEKIYISIGFVPETMAEFIRILDSKDWGITIRKIN